MEEAAKVVVVNHLTMDGVMQGPARSDEDERDGFSSGGWAEAGDDPVMQAVMGKQMAPGWSLLVGRTTYEGMYEGWVHQRPDHPMTAALTKVDKYVASHDPDLVAPWDNTTVLSGDVGGAVDRLRRRRGDAPLIIFGSGVLVHSLVARGLIDELVLMTHPRILGEGRRLFDGFPISSFELVDQVPTSTGVLITTHRLVDWS